MSSFVVPNVYILPIDILSSLSLSSFNSFHNVWCQTTKAACHSSRSLAVRLWAPETACLHHLQDVSEIVQRLQGGSRQREQCSTHSHIWNTGGNRERLTYAFDRIQCTDTDLSSHLQFGTLSCWLVDLSHLHPLICTFATLLPISTSFSHSSPSAFSPLPSASRLPLSKFTSSPALSSQTDVVYFPPLSHREHLPKSSYGSFPPLMLIAVTPTGLSPAARRMAGRSNVVNLRHIIAASLHRAHEMTVHPQAFTLICSY